MMKLPTWIWPLSPWILALVCLPLSLLCPLDRVFGHIASAGFLMAPRWLLFLSPIWLLIWIGLGHLKGELRARSLWLLLAIPGVLLGGIHPSWMQPAEPPAHTIRLVSANVNAYSDLSSPDTLEATLASLEADIIMVIEQRADQIEGMVRVADNFEEDLPRISHATAVFCREDLLCEARVSPEYGSESMKMPVGIARLPEAGICFLGIHAPPPAPYDPTGIEPYIAVLASHIEQGRIRVAWDPCQVGDRVLIAGDLNAVPWSDAWSTLMHQGLDDRLWSWGIWGASWPSGGGWPDLPFFQLDHLLVGDIEVERVVQARLPGSDHKALVFDIRP